MYSDGAATAKERSPHVLGLQVGFQSRFLADERSNLEGLMSKEIS